jgi:predicted XRE-type DNA-binding protein
MTVHFLHIADTLQMCSKMAYVTTTCKEPFIVSNFNDNSLLMQSKGEIVIYKAKDGSQQIEVKLEENTVWLNQKQIASLFGIQRPAITKHLSNIFKSKELAEKSVSSILEHTARDGKVYKPQYYNSGELKINDNALVALALLVAQSNPDDKEIMIKLVMNLIRS